LEDRTRITLAKTALAAIERKRHRLAQGEETDAVYDHLAGRVSDLYRERIEVRSLAGDEGVRARREEQIERAFRLAAIRAQREEINRLARTRQIGSALSAKITRELDLLEVRYRGDQIH
jgi:hypothetical protein